MYNPVQWKKQEKVYETLQCSNEVKNRYIISSNEIIEKVPLVNNQSVDFLVIKGKVKFAFQCKFHNAPLNYDTVKEIIHGVKFFDSHVVAVVTNNSFRRPARELADSNNIVLWNGDDLIRLINSINY